MRRAGVCDVRCDLPDAGALGTGLSERCADERCVTWSTEPGATGLLASVIFRVPAEGICLPVQNSVSFNV